MGIPISNVTRRVVFAASGTGPYSFTFEILAETDVSVYKDDVLLTLTTDYLVTINANGTGYITLTSTPTGATQIAVVGDRAIERTSDFVTGGDFFANTVNRELDSLTIFAQQNAESVDRALKAPQTDPTTVNMTLPRSTVRANKTLAFDANGNPTTGEVVGDNRGTWAASTSYAKRDIVKDSTNQNIYYANTAHTSSGALPISTNADAAKWDLLVDAVAPGAAQAAAEAAQAAAEAAQTAAETAETNAASSASGASTSASNAATSASNASTSATSAASSASSASTSASNASTSATNASTSASAAATSASNASSSATAASGSATNAANSASAASTSASNASTSATNAANSATTAGTHSTNAANSATASANSATASANSATAAAASAAAAAASFDAFDDIYLGAKSSDPSVDNDGDALTVGDQYFNSVANELRVWNGSSWQAASTVGGTVNTIAVNTSAALNYGTANGVTYLNGSKVLTSGSALTFDGSTFTLGANGSFTSSYSGNGLVLSKTNVGSKNAIVSVADTSSVLLINNSAAGWDSVAMYAAGSERMRLTSTGLGIGTSSPNFKLSFGANIGNTFAVYESSGSNLYGIGMGGDGSGGNPYRTKLFSNGSEAVSITSAGNVGIGTSSPGNPLTVRTSGTSTSVGGNIAARIESNGSGYASTLQFSDNVANSSYISMVGSATAFGQAGTEKMRIDSSGNVGIGTSSPGYKLDVQDSVTGNLVIRVKNTNAGASATGRIYLHNDQADNVVQSFIAQRSSTYSISPNSLQIGTTYSHPLIFITSSVERLRIDSSGNVGIGTTSPQRKLDVTVNDTSTAQVYLRNNNASYASGLIVYNDSGQASMFRHNGGSDTSYAGANSVNIGSITNNVVGFIQNNTERARIDSSGNLLVGTTTARGRFHSASIGGFVPASAGAWASLTSICVSGGFGGGISFIDGSAGYGMYCSDNGNDFYIQGATSLSGGLSGGVFLNDRGTSWSSASDERMKTIIEPITDAVAKVSELRAVIGRYNYEEEHKRHPFLIAQDVEKVLPEAVSVANKADPVEDQRLAVSYTDTIPLLVAAIKELKAENDSLKARLDAANL